MLTVTDVSLRFSDRKLFDDVNIKFTEGNTYGLIGANGAGKSTFLKILAGDIEPTTGHISLGPDERLSVLRQNHFDYEDERAIDVVIMGNEKLYSIMKEKDAIYMKEDFSDEDGVRAAELEGEFAELGGWEAESEASQLLQNLNIPEELHYQNMSELANGDKVKVLLAKALFGKPDVLLLDEPTNGLDIQSITWLEDFLIDFENTVIVVSHDRHFLNKVCTHMADLDFGKIKLYVGSLKNRVLMQNEDKYQMFVFLADQQALTDHAKDPQTIVESIGNVALDYLAAGLDPNKSTIFIQSQIPELAELTMYYMNLVSVSRLERNPTVKTEIAQKGFGESIPSGFLVYPVSQAADITAFKANLVPVGTDQKPMIEQTREIVRSFNHAYHCDVLVEPEGIFPENEAAGRLPGLDGNAKMSKSLGNGIYLADDMDTLKKKVMSMYTDPEHIRVEDPGKIEGNMVFHYLDVFGKEEDQATIQDMKDHYQRGGLGDVKTKRYLLEILERELGPIRERRIEFAKDMGQVYDMLQKGSEVARSVAAETLDQVKSAMGLNYFK